MQMQESHIISASCEKVWQALNDADVLRAAIPGCKELEKKSETELHATVAIKIGPVKANFKGEINLSELNPPISYKISGEGKGGIAGFAKGGAKVMLEEVEEGTKLSYEVEAKIGGKLAQLGSRLIDSTAKKLAKEFFTNFANQL